MATNREMVLVVLLLISKTTNSVQQEKFRPIIADIVLAIDTSTGAPDRSPQLVDLSMLRLFLRRISRAFPLTAEHSRMAVVEFAENAKVRVPLERGVDSSVIAEAFDDTSVWYDESDVWRNGTVDYGAMFKLVYGNVFAGSTGDRPNVPNLLMVLTIVPTFRDDNLHRWLSRASRVARGRPYNMPEPAGVITTDGYGSPRGTHLPKMTSVRGLSFSGNAWEYQDFVEVMQQAILHLRHAVRAVWIGMFHSELHMRQLREFDYQSCRAELAHQPLARRQLDDPHLVGDLLLALDLPQDPTQLRVARTFLLNLTQSLPLSAARTRIGLLELLRNNTCRILAPPSAGADAASLVNAVARIWRLDEGPNVNASSADAVGQANANAKATADAVKTADAKSNAKTAAAAAAAAVDLDTEELRHQRRVHPDSWYPTVERILLEPDEQRPNVPALVAVMIVWPLLPQETAVDWVRRLGDWPPVAALGRRIDALLVASNFGDTDVLVCGLSTLVNDQLLLQTDRGFAETVPRLAAFVAEVVRGAAVRRCRCRYDDAGRCLFDESQHTTRLFNISFVARRYCQTVLGQPCDERVCARECDRHPWSAWGRCWPVSIFNRGRRQRRRLPLDAPPGDVYPVDHCPLDVKPCLLVERWTRTPLAVVSLLVFFLAYLAVDLAWTGWTMVITILGAPTTTTSDNPVVIERR